MPRRSRCGMAAKRPRHRVGDIFKAAINSELGCGSCSDGDALNADELKTPLGRTFHFETQFDGLANALRDLVEGPRLCVTSRKLWD